MKHGATILLFPLICLGLTACVGGVERADDGPIHADDPTPGLFHLLPIKSATEAPASSSSITRTGAAGAKLEDARRRRSR